MVTSIQLGNFFTSGSKTVLGGVGGSGLDTEGLVTGLTDAKRLPAVELETKIETNGKRSAALKEFKTLLASVKDAVSFLRNPPGVGNQAQNAFLYTKADVISNDGSIAGNYLSVTTSPGVTAQNFAITDITSVARAKQQSTANITFISPETSFDADADFVTSVATNNRFKAGTFSLDHVDADEADVSITLEAGDSLNEVAAKFNAVKNDTGIAASIIKVSSNNYRLVFTATATGTEADFDLDGTTTLKDPSGVLSLTSRSNVVTNGNFASNISGWTNDSVGTAEGIAFASGKLQLNGEGIGNEAFAKQAITTVIGQQYTVRATFAGSPNAAAVRIGTNPDVLNAANYNLANQTVNANGEVLITFTATSTTSYLTFNSGTGTAPITVDDVSVIQSSNEYADLQTASNAEFLLNGVLIARQNNAVSDVVAGVTFNILQATPNDTELSATISPDIDVAKSAIINLINAYNDMRVFAAKQLQTGGDGLFTEDAVLSSNSTFRNTVSNITNTLTQVVSGLTSGDPNRLADIGVTFSDLPESEDAPLVRNILDLNEGTLVSKLSKDFDAFRRVFEFDFNSTNPNLRVFSRTNSLTISDFSLEITAATPPALPTATVSYNGGQTTMDVIAIKDRTTEDVIGYTLKGKDGTVLAGLSLVYSSTSASTTTVTATQGLADKLFNISETVLKRDVGSLDVDLKAIETADERLTSDIAKIDEFVERFRQQLLDKFAALEQAISRINTILQSIDAQNNARNNA